MRKQNINLTNSRNYSIFADKFKGRIMKKKKILFISQEITPYVEENELSEIAIYPLLKNSSSTVKDSISIPESRSKLSALAILDNIFILGGNVDHLSNRQFGFQYSLVTNQWGKIVPAPQIDIQGFATANAGSDIFIIGGILNGEFSNKVYSYHAFNVVFIPIAR